MDPASQKLRKDIKTSLAFTQSSLEYPKPEDFLTKLVCNLLDEGNAFLRDGDWEKAVTEFSEGLNAWNDARQNDIHLSEILLESLYVRRAAAYHNMGKYDWGINDCDKALKVCKESRKGLYRKALCLKALGKYREAYDCTTACLLITRLDRHVNELAQELAICLGLKNQTPTGDHTTEKTHILDSTMNSDVIKVPAAHVENGFNNLSGLPPVSFPSMPQATIPSTAPLSFTVPDTEGTVDDSELIGDYLDILLDSASNDQEDTEIQYPAAFSVTCRTSSSVLPPPNLKLPQTLFSSPERPLSSLDPISDTSLKTATLDALDDLSTPVTGGGAASLGALDALDGLDSLDEFPDTTPSVTVLAADENESKSELDKREKSIDELLGELYLDEFNGNIDGVRTVEHLGSLDALDSFPSEEGVAAPLPAVPFGETGFRSGAAPAIRSPKNSSNRRSGQTPVAVTNPLFATHEFLQACSDCFFRKGQGINTFIHKPDLVHNCKQDILLCKRKTGHPSEWTRVRPIPKWSDFTGPYKLCRDMQKGMCKYGEDCNFAYNQLEIDVWTEERKGMLDRKLLFETAPLKMGPVDSIIHLLEEDNGMFMFLCQECFDSEPRIISDRSKDTHTTCSNLNARHTFDANKCLVFVKKNHREKYWKVRSLSVLCQLDLCRHGIRYGCQRENCMFAHSAIEFKTWRVQRDTGISPDEIVKISTKYHDKHSQSSSKPKGNRLSSGGEINKPKGSGGGGVKSLKWTMKFACGQCWRECGLISEPDKALKYCTAKARHPWTKDKWSLLIRLLEGNKWVQVRPLPHAKNFPPYYDMCKNILEKKKCNYIRNCTFAHSQEEKETWTYMKNNNLLDMQQMYDMWLTQNAHTRQSDEAAPTQSISEKKNIIMPTDFPEPESGFYCRLCGRHSNGERQWQRHISSEKHKDRVFSCEREEDALKWNHRFPGRCFKLCPKLEDGCSDGVSCDYAHSPEELQEWIERRDVLRQKLARAKEDLLVMPDESDFGKYNFLLQD